MTNIELAQTILQKSWRAGVREIVLCAGARNAPFVKLLSEGSPFKIYSFFEERSASFFALGRTLDTNRPVAVITTSGTAAAELLPACIEADYQRKPLLLITADRPRRYRGSGAPQAIIQTGLYSHYVGSSFDVEGNWDGDLRSALALGRPVHVNVCFDEPLVYGQAVAWDSQEMAIEPDSMAEPVSVQMKKPLVIVAGLAAHEAARVLPWLSRCQRPLFLEATSRLRGHPLLADWEIQGGEKSIRELDFDGVIRLGSVPTLRFWRDLESGSWPVACFSSVPFSGLPRVSQVWSLSQLPTDLNFEKWSSAERERDRKRGLVRRDLLKEFPLSEPSWMAWLSERIPTGARLFLGNSLPIREWDFAATSESARDIFANRGTNGIDGLISTFAGVAGQDLYNWAILGDLSLMYDLSGPWALLQRELRHFNLVVINNGGGQIFQRMFADRLFLNEHNLNFKAWAELWSLEYMELRKERKILHSGRQLIEIVPDAAQTQQFWKLWEEKA